MPASASAFFRCRHVPRLEGGPGDARGLHKLRLRTVHQPATRCCYQVVALACPEAKLDSLAVLGIRLGHTRLGLRVRVLLLDCGRRGADPAMYFRPSATL